MGWLSSLANYLNTKSNMLNAQQSMQCNYANIGMQIYEILSRVDFPYLDKYLDFTEVCTCFNSCTLTQYVYALKLHRPMADDECKFLARYMARELCKSWNMAYADFSKQYKVLVVNSNLFVSRK